MQRKYEFLSHINGIFGDSKDDWTPKKIRKNTDDLREATIKVTNSNINQTYQQKKNKDIKYQNNKKKSRKKEKSTVQNSSNEDSIDEDNNNSVPGLQDRDQPDSSSDVDVCNRSDNADYLDTESDDTYYQLPYDLTIE